MKKVILGCSVLAAALVFVASCNKKTNPEPQQDTEFQSSKDVAFANQTVTDIDVIASYLGEQTQGYFIKAPGSGGSISPISFDTTGTLKKLEVVYSNSVICVDGKKRSGTITLTYSSSPAGSKFYRRPSFTATVSLTNFQVDGNYIVNNDPIGHPFTIKNVTPVGFNPSSEKLKWDIDADITIRNIADSSKNITWNGKLTKTLVNTNDNKVYDPSNGGTNPIKWSIVYVNNNPTTPGAIVEYEGGAKGNTMRTTPYTFTISPLKDDAKLTRVFACTPDKILGVTQTTTNPVTIAPVYAQWHPFVGGVCSFTTGTGNEPRRLDFSNEGNLDCDNSGKVTIKGIDYTVDFQK